MPTAFREGYLVYVFEDLWNVDRYDGHAFHRQNGIPGKAIDFIGVFDETSAYFVEATDYRSDPTQMRQVATNGELAEEFAAKSRDTRAGLLQYCTGAPGEPSAWSQLTAMLRAGKAALLVLWCEERHEFRPRYRDRQKTENLVLTRLIRRELRKLDLRYPVLVVRRGTYEDVPPGIRVCEPEEAPADAVYL